MRTFFFRFNVDTIDDSWWTIWKNESRIIEANSIDEAKDSFFEALDKDYGIDVSKNARKTAEKLYADTPNGTRQVGYTIKGSTMVDFGGRWVRKYADIHTRVNELVSVFDN